MRLQRILAAVARRRKGESERRALRRLFPAVDRSSFRRWKSHHAAFGVDGLFDLRAPPRGPGVANPLAGEQRLELGGMKLVEAACVETGYVEALAAGVMDELTETSSQAKRSPALDTSNRDEWGRFLSDYNQRLRKGGSEELGPGFAGLEGERAGF